MNIGDLFWSFRGTGTQLQKDAQVEGGKAGTSLGKSMSASLKKSWSGAEIGKGLVQGLGLAGGLGAARLFSTAVSEVTDVLGDAVRAGIEEENSIDRLATSIRSNVKDWDGNTAAIERVIKARMDLGFSDDEQRESLARLVGATKDINDALELERTAMDLSRFKQISLAEASQALIDIDGGRYRQLGKLIGSTKNITNSTEAMAAVQEVAGGQAEAFGERTEGAMKRAEVAADELKEMIGTELAPVIEDLSNKFVDEGVPAIENEIEGLKKLATEAKNTGESASDALDPWIKGLEDFADVVTVWDGMDHDAREAAATTDTVAGKMADDLATIETALDDAGDAADKWSDAFRDAGGEVIRASHRIRDALVKDAAIARGEVFDETETRAALHKTRLDLFALEDERRSARTAEARRQATDDIIQALDDEGGALEDLAATGDLTEQDVARFEKDVKSHYKDLSKEGREQLDALIRKYRALAAMKDIVKTFTINTRQGTGTHPGGGGPQEFAEGGVVQGPRGTAVPIIAHAGERVLSLAELRRPSITVPSYHASLATQSIASLSAGGGGYTDNSTNNVNVAGLLPVRTMADIRRERTTLQDARRLRNGLGRR